MVHGECQLLFFLLCSILFYSFPALASADLVFCMSCITRGFRVATRSSYYLSYPIIKFFSQFAYTTSIFLTVALIIHRYMVFVRGSQPKNEGFARIKKIIFGVVLGAFIYCIPMMLEFTWAEDECTGDTIVVNRFSDDDDDESNKTVFKLAYKAWANFVFRFLIPIILLVVFSILIVKEVRSNA